MDSIIVLTITLMKINTKIETICLLMFSESTTPFKLLHFCQKDDLYTYLIAFARCTKQYGDFITLAFICNYFLSQDFFTNSKTWVE